MPGTIQECAGRMLEAIPAVMFFIGEHMRTKRGGGLSAAHFRLLGFLERHDAATLSAAAQHLGVTLPSMSRMARVLEARQLVIRQIPAHDRRRAFLQLTSRGKDRLSRSRRAVQADLAQELVELTPDKLEKIDQAMNALRELFDREKLPDELL